MTIKVVNKYKEPNHIYCGRGSPVGNPYPINVNYNRDDVCNMYEDLFNMRMREGNNPMSNFVDKLVVLASKEDVNLGCFCAPKRCHCDTIKRYIDNKLNKRN